VKRVCLVVPSLYSVMDGVSGHRNMSALGRVLSEDASAYGNDCHPHTSRKS